MDTAPSGRLTHGRVVQRGPKAVEGQTDRQLVGTAIQVATHELSRHTTHFITKCIEVFKV